MPAELRPVVPRRIPSDMRITPGVTLAQFPAGEGVEMKTFSRLVSVALTAGAISLFPGVSALADCGWNDGHFCGYDNNEWKPSPPLFHSGASAGSNEVDIQNDRLNSAHNRTNNRWCLYTNRLFSPPRLVFDMAQDTSVSTFYPDNNTIDWANVRQMSVGCP